MTWLRRSGRGWSRCCLLIGGRGHRWNDHRLVLDGIFFRAPGPGARGGICQSGSATGRPSITGIAAGRGTGPGRWPWTSCGAGAGPGPGPGGCWATRPIPAPRSGPACAGAGSRPRSPEPAGQVKNRLRCGSRGGRPPAFDAAAYKQRNIVERALCHLRQHRAVATRYDKRDFVWRETVDVASIRIWLRHPVP
jgi:hypothetical protein